jgi:hypothetical protein
VTINDDRDQILLDAMAAEPDGWTTERVSGLFRAAGLDVDRNTCWGLLRHHTRRHAEDDGLFPVTVLAPARLP